MWIPFLTLHKFIAADIGALIFIHSQHDCGYNDDDGGNNDEYTFHLLRVSHTNELMQRDRKQVKWDEETKNCVFVY